MFFFAEKKEVWVFLAFWPQILCHIDRRPANDFDALNTVSNRFAAQSSFYPGLN